MGIKKGLGKGLKSLIPEKRLDNKRNRKGNWIRPEKESIFYIEIDKIKPNPFQPRRSFPKSSLKELACSIREQGILQPLLVTKIEKTTERGQDVEYYVIAGERRLRAAKMAGLTQVPVIIRPAAGYQKLELALIENIQREDLNPIEEAKAFKKLKEEHGITYKEIAEKLGKSEFSVINTVRLLKLPLTIQRGVYEGKITEGHAKAILMAKPGKRLSLYYKTIKNNLTVRDIERLASKMPAKAPKPRKDPELDDILNKLRNIFTEKVRIIRCGNTRKLIMEFADKKNFNRAIKKLISVK